MKGHLGDDPAHQRGDQGRIHDPAVGVHFQLDEVQRDGGQHVRGLGGGRPRLRRLGHALPHAQARQCPQLEKK